MGFAAGDYLVVSQVRLNVNSLGSGTAGVIITVSAQMSGTSSFSSSNPITFTNSNVPVATATPPSLTVRVTSAGAMQTCGLPIGTFKIKITENYPAAITSTSDETGFTPSVLPAPANGSQVVVTLAGVPAGMSVAFGTAGVPAGNSVQTVTGPTTFTLSSTTGTAIQTVPAGGGNLTWTFIAANGNDSTAVSESTTLNFTIGAVTSGAFTANSPFPPIGSTVNPTATVSYGPVVPTSTLPITPVGFATYPEAAAAGIATIGDCVTNILFPYMTNQGGFDTSFSFANTSSDALAFGAGNGATATNGSCVMTFWPTSDTTLASASPLGTTLQLTTLPTIPAGSVYAFNQSQTIFSGQTGYAIAVCRFLNAHAFAFQINGYMLAGGPHISNGYLGLVIPNPVSGRTGANGETLVH
jgi:hypothetical protein